MDYVEDKELEEMAGGSLKDQYCTVKCKSCGKYSSMPKDSFLDSGSIYGGHHLCPHCGQDVFGSQIVG